VAMELFHEAVRANPRCARAYKSLAYYYLEQQRFEDAIKACHCAVELDPGYEPGYVELALASERSGDLAQAATALENAIRLNPHNLQYRLGLARNLINQGLLREAAECLRQATSVFPERIEGRQALAEICADLGDYEGVLQEAEKIRALAPTNPVAYDLLAMGHFQNGRVTEAIAAVRRLISLEPNEAHHHLKLGILLQHQGRLTQAMHEFMRAAAMSSEHDADTEHAAREAIANLDDVQVRQILLRATEDRVFRVKLMRDPAGTALDHGFSLSEEALSALMSMDFEQPQLPDEGRSQVYH